MGTSISSSSGTQYLLSELGQQSIGAPSNPNSNTSITEEKDALTTASSQAAQLLAQLSPNLGNLVDTTR
jgi:hypothetical protein